MMNMWNRVFSHLLQSNICDPTRSLTLQQSRKAATMVAVLFVSLAITTRLIAQEQHKPVPATAASTDTFVGIGPDPNGSSGTAANFGDAGSSSDRKLKVISDAQTLSYIPKFGSGGVLTDSVL